MYQNHFTGYGYNCPYPRLSPLEIQKTYLANYKQYLLKLRDSVAEYAKQIEEALTAIDSEESRLRKAEFAVKEQTKSGAEE